jgi:diadenosine tetraphosphatase ApaH/serine/threonine PP2A family protein phosphatase
VFEVDGDEVAEIPAEGAVRLGAGRIHFVNPGSVDASRKRTQKRAEFALFDSAGSSVEFHRVAYDDAATESKAWSNGYRIERWRDRLYDVQRRVIGPRHQEGETA